MTETSNATEQPAAAAQPEWLWYAGDNDETFSIGPCSTKEEIIANAVGDGIGEWLDDSEDPPLRMQTFDITEARQDPLRLSDWIEADTLLERADECLSNGDRVSTDYDDAPWFNADAAQEADLVRRVKAACDEWQAHHGLVFKCNTFSHQRNSETITRAISDTPAT